MIFIPNFRHQDILGQASHHISRDNGVSQFRPAQRGLLYPKLVDSHIFLLANRLIFDADPAAGLQGEAKSGRRGILCWTVVLRIMYISFRYQIVPSTASGILSFYTWTPTCDGVAMTKVFLDFDIQRISWRLLR